MKLKKITLLGVASVAAIGLSLSATPAFAATWDGDDVDFSSGGYWDVENEPLTFFGPNTTAWVADGSNTFDDGLMVFANDGSTDVDCTTADLSPAADGSGDQILTCEPEDLPIGPTDQQISVAVELRFFADNQTVRQIITVKNTTEAAVSGAEIISYSDFFQDGATNIAYSNTLGSTISNWPAGNSDAADVLAETDNIFVTDCPGATCDPSYTGANVMQLYGPDAPVHSTFFDTANYPALGGDVVALNADDDGYFSFELPALAVDQEVSIVIMTRTYLYLYGADNAATNANALVASQDAVAFAEAGGWNCDQVMVGIADPTKVVNYNCAASLPDTGLNTGPLAVGAGVLMLAGVAIVVALRRRARA